MAAHGVEVNITTQDASFNRSGDRTSVMNIRTEAQTLLGALQKAQRLLAVEIEDLLPKEARRNG
jgi:hypothetical protein